MGISQVYTEEERELYKRKKRQSKNLKIIKLVC